GSLRGVSLRPNFFGFECELPTLLLLGPQLLFQLADLVPKVPRLLFELDDLVDGRLVRGARNEVVRLLHALSGIGPDYELRHGDAEHRGDLLKGCRCRVPIALENPRDRGALDASFVSEPRRRLL